MYEYYDAADGNPLVIFTWVPPATIFLNYISLNIQTRSEGVRSALRALEARLRQFESGLRDHKANNKVMKEIDEW